MDQGMEPKAGKKAGDKPSVAISSVTAIIFWALILVGIGACAAAIESVNGANPQQFVGTGVCLIAAVYAFTQALKLVRKL